MMLSFKVGDGTDDDDDDDDDGEIPESGTVDHSVGYGWIQITTPERIHNEDNEIIYL